MVSAMECRYYTRMPAATFTHTHTRTRTIDHAEPILHPHLGTKRIAGARAFT